MTYNAFQNFCKKASLYQSFGEYASEFDEESNKLYFCWNYGRDRSFFNLHKLSGLSQAAFARSYQIPLRCIEDWLHSRRAAPSYVIDLLAFSVFSDLYF